MFDIGFWELVLLFVIALVVVGPERLPGVARTAGLWIGRARRIMSEVRDEVERELRVEELKRSLAQQDTVAEIKQLAERVKSINADVQKELADASRSDSVQPPELPPPPGAGTGSAPVILDKPGPHKEPAPQPPAAMDTSSSSTPSLK